MPIIIIIFINLLVKKRVSHIYWHGQRSAPRMEYYGDLNLTRGAICNMLEYHLLRTSRSPPKSHLHPFEILVSTVQKWRLCSQANSMD